MKKVLVDIFNNSWLNIIALLVFLFFATLTCLPKNTISKEIKLHEGEIEFKRGDILIKANHNNFGRKIRF